ncbi:MAG: T9SS type A sorting domain-containing protein [Bacteroidales bacterium]
MDSEKKNRRETVTLNLTESSQVKISVFDNYGRLVAQPVNAFQQKGEQKVIWNAGNLPAGIYFYRIITDTRQATGRMILVK